MLRKRERKLCTLSLKSQEADKIQKFVAILALAVAVSASDISSSSYGVADPYTGDFKHQVENRLNNNVQGQYLVLESDAAPAISYAAPAISYAASAISYAAGAYLYAAPYGFSKYRAFGLKSALPYRGLYD
ncbi:unnamed protein product [Arctia plantaginis]|uniref:Uncharacterized protein n=1 Tax=Arctia plantaginis TaxID=874455 RepID=A0A8S1AQK7_ARCPL|nr:unnamed protein product [Arctia plantaginis]